MNRYTIGHFCLANQSNAGDNFLFAAVKQVFETLHGPIRWIDYDLRSVTRIDQILRINISADAALVGGGGLFLADTNPNRYSGWQWKCPRYCVQLIRKPLVMYAIGYNRFPGQPEFGETFIKHVSLCLEKASFVGLRNHGSIRAVTNLVGDELGQRIRFQPCPSIFFRANTMVEREPMTLAINLAFDREKLRFKEHKRQIIEGICRSLARLEDSGWRILIVHHMPTDREWDKNAKQYLRRPEVVDLSFASAEQTARFYQRVSLAIGMRGHSQLIPFGQGCRIISLISHDKLAWFLDDIGMPELGIEVLDNDLEGKIVSLVERYNTGFDLYDRLSEAYHHLWEITVGNHEIISTALGIPFERKPANIDT